MADDLDDALKRVMDQYSDKIAHMTMAKRQAVTLAGGHEFEKRLKQVTRERHYSKRNEVQYGHMADTIGAEAHDGVTDVGFDKHHAYIARFLNDGTKKDPADHFVTNLRQDKETIKAVVKAEKDALKKELDH